MWNQPKLGVLFVAQYKCHIVKDELDGCIVWNAHNTVLGEEAISNIHRSGMLRKDR